MGKAGRFENRENRESQTITAILVRKKRIASDKLVDGPKI